MYLGSKVSGTADGDLISQVLSDDPFRFYFP